MSVTLSAEPLRETFRIPKHRRHVPAVRARVRETLERWGLEHLVPDVELVASELVTNAVVHCRVVLAEIEIGVRVDDGDLVLEVSDPDRDRHPRPGRGVPTTGRAGVGCGWSRRWPMAGDAGGWSTGSACGRGSRWDGEGAWRTRAG
ncbi:ATP-binding protein [Streptomyces sp. NPDC088554]|uniref:ATP-binding protein n=1 Tax=Streptomyces sp. NPDC088554 TaxID=3365865 RepID=UPI0037FE2E3D